MAVIDIITEINDSVAEAWGTLFQKMVGLREPDIEPIASASFLSEMEGEFASSEVTFTGDVEGRARFWIKKEDALTMAGMMMAMGADDELVKSTREKESLDDDDLDALNEIFNQLAATSATVLRDKSGGSVQASASKAEAVTLNGSIDGWDDSDTLAANPLDLEGFEASKIYQAITAQLFESLDFSTPVSELPDEAPAQSGEEEQKEDKSKINIAALRDLTVRADAILAERIMDVNSFSKICVGSVIEFWKPCDHPADLIISNRLFANGEVVVTRDQRFALRIQEIAPIPVSYDKKKSVS